MFSLLFILAQASLARAESLPGLDPNEVLRQLTPAQRESCGPMVRQELAKWDLCSGTFESVCEVEATEPLMSIHEIRAAVFNEAELTGLKKISRGVERPEGSPEKQKALRAYANLMRKAYEQAKSYGEKRGAKFNKLGSLLEEIKGELLHYLASSSKFRTKKSALNAVKKIELFDPSFFASADDEDIEAFYKSCGSDGLNSHAHYDTKINKVVLCPGYLMNNARPDGLNAMVLLLAHELSHAVDPLQADSKNDFYLLDGYDGYFACLEDKYGSEFRSIEDATKSLRDKSQPSLVACVKKLQAAEAPEKDIAEVQDSFDDNVVRLGELKEMTEYFQGSFENPSPVITHGAELAADMLASEVIGRLLKKSAPELRAGLVRKQLAFFCRIGEKNRRMGELCGFPEVDQSKLGDNGTHPRSDYRVESFLGNPRVREALGCPAAPANPKRPWCGL